MVRGRLSVGTAPRAATIGLGALNPSRTTVAAQPGLGLHPGILLCPPGDIDMLAACLGGQGVEGLVKDR